MKKKKNCDNCRYVTVDYKCTNENYLNARICGKSTGRALCYCTWYERKEILQEGLQSAT